MLVYLRTPRAATPAPSTEHSLQPFSRRRSADSHQPVQTLWATRPLLLACGSRVVAVRLNSEGLKVGLATADGVRWVRPERVMSERQAQAWVSTSKFAPQG